MKTCLSLLIAGVIATMFVGVSAAMPAAATVEQIPGAYPLDCARWKDKARCDVLNREIKVCRDKTDDAWLECMHLSAPTAKFTPPKPRDCSTARNKERCEEHVRALEACKDKTTRAEHRKCIAGQLQAQVSNKN